MKLSIYAPKIENKKKFLVTGAIDRGDPRFAMKQNLNSKDGGLHRKISLGSRGSTVHPLTFGGLLPETDNSKRFSKFGTKIPHGEEDDDGDD